MDVSYNYHLHKKIKLGLVFFCMLSFIGCTKKVHVETVHVHYDEGKATTISFHSAESVDAYAVFVKGTDETAVLGAFRKADGQITFIPVIPLSNGQGYVLKKGATMVAEFTIEPNKAERPIVLAVYPTTDTIPENLLKIYLVFSKPMQEVHSALDYIDVYNITKDMSTNIFLPLENELWNKEHTVLTLWLDPGRIKRDLIPNREKGQPLEAGNSYRLSIDQQWQDAQGNYLEKGVLKEFFVEGRDSKKPDLKNWKLQLPKKGTIGTLVISYPEVMDAMLLQETIVIRAIDTTQITGTFKLTEKEQGLIFTPNDTWKTGNYQLVVNSKLEDLAGNNLNHLFDKDLLISDKSIDTEFKSLLFTIE